jgi:predicted amidophosphoribosyltransferase
MKNNQDFCGCCGREILNHPESIWCEDCLPHLSKDRSKPLWEKTYESQHGTPCPFADKKAEPPRLDAT